MKTSVKREAAKAVNELLEERGIVDADKRKVLSCAYGILKNKVAEAKPEEPAAEAKDSLQEAAEEGGE